MATVTHAVTTPNTANASSYASGAFTPNSNDLLVVFVNARLTVAAGTCTSSVSGQSFVKVGSAVYAAGAHTLYCFISTRPATNASQTVTFDCTGDASTGTIIHVSRVLNVEQLHGASAQRQWNKTDNGAAAGTPAPVFSTAGLTDNVMLGAIANASNPAGLTPPASWNELADSGNTETFGLETAYIASGFTGTTVTWGSTSATVFAALIVEINISRLPKLSVYPQILSH